MKNLIRAAIEARKSAYCPYSEFSVGAALLTLDGKIYTGCNVESAAYSATICAERTALCKAVSDGARSFAAIAIAGGGTDVISTYCAPCGVCRQMLFEFGEMRVILAKSEDDYVEMSISELLPKGFGADSLK